MGSLGIKNQMADKVIILDHKSLWDDNEFLEELDNRIKEIEIERVLGSTWDEIKAKSKA